MYPEFQGAIIEGRKSMTPPKPAPSSPPAPPAPPAQPAPPGGGAAR
jgi:hypothetical protein